MLNCCARFTVFDPVLGTEFPGTVGLLLDRRDEPLVLGDHHRVVLIEQRRERARRSTGDRIR